MQWSEKLKLKLRSDMFPVFRAQVRDKFMASFSSCNKFSIKIYSAFIKKLQLHIAYRGQMVPIFCLIGFLLGVKIIVYTAWLLFFIFSDVAEAMMTRCKIVLYSKEFPHETVTTTIVFSQNAGTYQS